MFLNTLQISFSTSFMYVLPPTSMPMGSPIFSIGSWAAGSVRPAELIPAKPSTLARAGPCRRVALGWLELGPLGLISKLISLAVRGGERGSSGARLMATVCKTALAPTGSYRGAPQRCRSPNWPQEPPPVLCRSKLALLIDELGLGLGGLTFGNGIKQSRLGRQVSRQHALLHLIFFIAAQSGAMSLSVLALRVRSTLLSICCPVSSSVS